jgi:hypothetical protein
VATRVAPNGQTIIFNVPAVTYPITETVLTLAQGGVPEDQIIRAADDDYSDDNDLLSEY